MRNRQVPVGRRICVIGNGGAGKSVLASALAERLGLRYVDRDALVWGANWQPLPPAERPAVFSNATSEGGWTYDGHLRADRPEERVVLARCDTIIWLDLPRWQLMWSITRRTLRRVLTRECLANGNVETWRMMCSREFSIRWAWRTHARLRQEYDRLFADLTGTTAMLLRFGSRDKVKEWLSTFDA